MYTQSTSNGTVGQMLGNKVVETITADRTLTAADAGKVFIIATDALTVTLPATIPGCRFTFINNGAAANNIITVAPVAADGIAGTITLASSVVTRVGTVNTALVNTKATTTKGNSVSIVGTGITGTGAWIIESSTGIWA